MPIIDFHAHAFPDSMVTKTIATLEQKSNVKPALDGKIESLLVSMQEANISKSVICSIATKPQQFQAILDWSKSIRNEQIIPFPSFHPESSTALAEIDKIHQQGFKGVKLHPYYQNFYLDEKRLLPIFAKLADCGLIVVMHTGFDIGFPRQLRVNPPKIARLIKKIPTLKFIATHLGSWQQWDEVHRELVGKDIYFDIAFSLEFLPAEKARKIILDHPADKTLFGTDSPWASQQNTITLLKQLDLGAERERKVLGENAQKLLSKSSFP